MITTFFGFFLVDEGIQDPNTTINGSLFKWRFTGGPMMA